jgi:hypothetical protein
MESLLKSLSISFLLRSLFAGVFFVISYQVAECGIKDLVPKDFSSLFSVVLPVSLFAGFTIYALHRALLYPFVELFLDNTKEKRNSYPLISDTSVDALNKIWEMESKKGEETQECARRLAMWADITHFHYLSALCIVAGAVFGLIIASSNNQPCWSFISKNYHPYCPLIILAITFTVAGLTSDWRLKRVRERILESRNKAKPCSQPDLK